LENISLPAEPYDHDLLMLCTTDYKSTLLPIFESEMWRHSRPLTDQENMCGIAGLKFVDGIKLNTAIGFPLTGPKRNYVTETQEAPDKPLVRTLAPEIQDEIKRCQSCYERGERGYPVIKACLKDEILSKPKCRVYYGNPTSLTFIIRKYFLPIIRVLQMNPLEAECAVGINSHGPEWEEFHQHVFKFGKDRIIGGDYSKYDQKLPSQLILAALRVLIDFARVCDYSEEDIKVMTAMSGDIAFAIVAFNGDLIGFTSGGHISGNSLTVIINGLAGSLNLRACYFSRIDCGPPEKMEPFRKCVAVATYGDDNGGSVRKGVKNFTIKAISEFLIQYGQVYTMPDKESELKDFLDYEEFEFLKRTSEFCPERGVHIGALAEKSIFKMLHMYMRSKRSVNTPELACALNIDTALREWGNHGRDVYEQRRVDMTKVAQMTGIDHLCTQLDVTYDDVIHNWKHQYDEEYAMFNTISEPFLPLD
jgi:hypothetical protein